MHESWQADLHWFSYFFNEKLKNFMTIKTNNGLRSPTNDSIYLTPRYGNKYDLAKQLPSYPTWHLVDPCYIERHNKLSESLLKKEKKSCHQTDQTMLSWRRFFILLGLKDVFTPASHLSYSLVDEDSSVELFDYQCSVCDFYTEKSEALDSQADIPVDMKRELTAFYRILEDNWDLNGANSLNKFKYMTKTNNIFDKSSSQYVPSK